MTRRRLPDRRRCLTLDLVHDGSRFAISIGYDGAGRAREVFISGSKSGSGLEAILNDASIAISLALQHGADPRALPNSMSQLGRPGERASVIGAAADVVAANSVIGEDRR